MFVNLKVVCLPLLIYFGIIYYIDVWLTDSSTFRPHHKFWHVSRAFTAFMSRPYFPNLNKHLMGLKPTQPDSIDFKR